MVTPVTLIWEMNRLCRYDNFKHDEVKAQKIIKNYFDLLGREKVTEDYSNSSFLNEY